MKVGIIGAGTMGAGIAQVFAQSEGYEVYLCARTEEKAQKGKSKVEKALYKRVEKGKMDKAAADAILSKITTGTQEICADCDLVIESVAENMEVKKNVFAQLEKICKDDCIFASTTSSLSITELDSCGKRHVVGMHFFNPAPVMKLVEVIAGVNTPQELIDKAIEISNNIGKVPVQVNDSPGFVVNRILLPMINEAIGIYSEGTASVEAIDSAMKFGANHPMGPLATADLIGLDICLAIMEVLYIEFGDSKYKPHPLLRKMVRGKRLGRKTGIGFYTYEDKRCASDVIHMNKAKMAG